MTLPSAIDIKGKKKNIAYVILFNVLLACFAIPEKLWKCHICCFISDDILPLKLEVHLISKLPKYLNRKEKNVNKDELIVTK